MDWLRDYWIFCWHYLGVLTPGKLLEMFMPCLLIDTPRYVLSKFIVFFVDLFKALLKPGFPAGNRPPAARPAVSIIVPGLNEEQGMLSTIKSLLENDYPNKEIIVIDDGSRDRTYELCRPYAERGLIKLFRKNIPGGKTSAANFGRSAATGSILVIVDSDTTFERDAISKIVAPFSDPRVGAVSGNIRVRNWRKNLVTRYQAAEFLHCIFMGRRLHTMLGTLNIASGAFGAFLKSAVQQVGGWDVGPGEDGDLTTKIRKLGYKVVFADRAVCHTDAPDTWKKFTKQRLRWSRGVIRYRMRKHFDMLNPFNTNFRLSNAMVVLDSLFFRILMPYSFLIYFMYMVLFRPSLLPLVLGLTWLVYAVLNMIQVPLILYYSDRRREDFQILLAGLIMTPYNIYHRFVRLTSMTQEILFRSSFKDPYVPQRIRESTIKW